MSLASLQPTQRPPRTKKDYSIPPEGVREGTLGLVPELYKSIAERESREQKNCYASGIHECQRQQAMTIMGFTKHETQAQRNNGHWRVSAVNGEDTHELVQTHLIKMGYTVEKDVEFRIETPDQTMSGRVDAKLSYFDQYGVHHELVLDIKSVKKEDFEKGAWSDKFPKYISQLSVYGYLLGIPRAVVLLFCRDDGRMREFEFEINEDEAVLLLDRAKTIMQFAHDHVLPPAEMWAGYEGSYYCKTFCGVYVQCRRQQETGIVQDLLSTGLTPQQIEEGTSDYTAASCVYRRKEALR